MIIAQIVQIPNGDQYLAYTAIGDSNLYILKANGTLQRLSGPNDHQSYQGELGGNWHHAKSGMEKLESGDGIILVSDGVTDFMSEQVLTQLILEPDTTPANLCGKIHQLLLDPDAQLEGRKKPNPGHKDGNDDLSICMMIVP